MAQPRPRDDNPAADDTETPSKARAVAPEGTGFREREVRAEPGRVRRVLKILGPGFITGSSDDDPTAIGTYATAGASLGYGVLWTALFTFPMMVVAQYISAKIGLASGMGFAQALKRRYSPVILYPAILALVGANVVTAAADIGAIAAAANLLVPIPILALIVPVGLILLALQIWGSYRLIVTVFKWLALTLLAFAGAAILAHPPALIVLRATFVPTLSPDPAFVATLVAIFGTNVSPYLFFWEASQEVEEKVEQGQTTLAERRGTSNTELRYAAWDNVAGMFFSNLMIYFVNLATAATLHATGKTSVNTAADAAQALRPIVGDGATILFAVGMIGSGFLAVPVLTASSGYVVTEIFGWNRGLTETPSRAKQFYAVVALSTLVGILIDLTGVDPIAALFWAAAINGVLAPLFLVLLMLIANNRSIMGVRVNSLKTNVFGWATTSLMLLAAIGLVATLKP
jgi:NRAMP (natural resistance-associated macrophage protein)-like metal ion transporter